MTKEAINQYLDKLEGKLLNCSAQIPIELSRAWTGQFPDEAAVYIFREDDAICYVGETGSLRGRMNDILNTKNHTVRRNLGNLHFSEHPNFEKASSSKSFHDDIEALLNERITKHLRLSYILVDLGRKELEERLFDKLQPCYSQKGKRGSKKTYTKAEKQQANKNAYEKWTTEDDEKLELLFCEGKTVKELSAVFGRNEGSINSRIKKLELREKYDR
ncbi:hypothetical protein [Niabella hirudinis]|uniref:hypothetical protein n=1 Tax=Niabella hirudinis TaxID=1285929 RepID=UPI003EB761E1